MPTSFQSFCGPTTHIQNANCFKEFSDRLPLHSLSCIFSTAFSAEEESLKLMKPWPLDLPSSPFATTALVISPKLTNISRNCSSSTSSPKFLTNTFVNFLLALPYASERCERVMKRPTYTFENGTKIKTDLYFFVEIEKKIIKNQIKIERGV